MRIAIVSLSYSPTNGPELTAVQLGEALQAKKIDVTLFAPANWTTLIKKHIPTVSQDLWSMPDFPEQTPIERRNFILSNLIKVLAYQDDFDLVHIGYQTYAYAIASNLRIPSVVVLNGQDTQRNVSQIKKTGAIVVALNEKDQKIAGADTFIYPGIPTETISPSFALGEGLIAVGRLTPQKDIPTAIQIAKKAQKKLTIVGRIGLSKEAQQYFQEEIAPHIDGKSVIHLEHATYPELMRLMASSQALLFPIASPETFGRVSAEALACGTPVIGTRVDPLPETLADSKVSFLSNNIDELADAARHTERFDRRACRDYAEKNFDSSTMTDRYLDLYKKILEQPSGK